MMPANREQAAVPEIPPFGANRRRPVNAPTMYPVPGENGGGGVSGCDDRFAEKDGAVFPGTDVLLDLWGACHLDDAEYTERAMRRIRVRLRV